MSTERIAMKRITMSDDKDVPMNDITTDDVLETVSIKKIQWDAMILCCVNVAHLGYQQGSDVNFLQVKVQFMKNH